MKKMKLLIPITVILISIFSTHFIPKGGILSTALSILSVACAAMLIFLTNPYKIKQRRDV